MSEQQGATNGRVELARPASSGGMWEWWGWHGPAGCRMATSRSSMPSSQALAAHCGVEDAVAAGGVGAVPCGVTRERALECSRPAARAAAAAADPLAPARPGVLHPPVMCSSSSTATCLPHRAHSSAVPLGEPLPAPASSWVGCLAPEGRGWALDRPMAAPAGRREQTRKK